LLGQAAVSIEETDKMFIVRLPLLENSHL
jgi:hypothetical protein